MTAKHKRRAGRQVKAWRLALALTLALLLVAAGIGSMELADRGYRFFTFREAGAGETGGTFTDQQFLARQAAQEKALATPRAWR